MKVRHATLIAALVLALVVGVAAGSSANQAALGDDGVLYTARVGAYSSLFPKGSAFSADANVLALEIQRPDGQRRRIIVPGGERVAPDAVPFVLWENASGRLYLVWEGLSHIHSAVRLVSFDGADWSEPLQISGHPFTKKSSPRLSVTRETYLRSGAEGGTPGERTVLHILWYEDDYGDVDVLYAPLVLDNGAPPAVLPPIFNLGLFTPDGGEVGTAPTASLLRSPQVVTADDQQSILIAMAHDATEQMVMLRVDVLPVELSAVADELARFLAEDGNDPCAGDVSALAERARAHLVVIGTRFSSYARSYLGEALREWLLLARDGACANGGAIGLAERARAHLVVIGRSALREVIVAQNAANNFLLTFDAAEIGQRNDLSVSVERVVSAPPAIGGGTARIHVAGAGRNLLVSWHVNRKLYYQEHDGTRWLPAQSLALTDSFSVEEAYALLEAKAR